jgi:RHS repeat-associated protein
LSREPADAPANSSQYTARETDGLVGGTSGGGLYYYRARYYDPVLKRFIAEDPISLQGGLNVYAYVEGNPVSFVDPDGELPDIPDWFPTNAIVGFGDGIFRGVTLGFGDLQAVRGAMGVSGDVDKCSASYRAMNVVGENLLPIGRFAYIGKAKSLGRGMPATWETAQQVSATRNSLKAYFRGRPLSKWINDYKDFAAAADKYGSPAAVIAAAGRTNPYWNTAAFTSAGASVFRAFTGECCGQ